VRDIEECVEIDLKAPLDARPQNLHRHRFACTAGLDFGAMHLRNRRGRDRRAEAGINVR
jgi:hypothetical protein